MPSPSLIAFQDKLATDPDLQEKCIALLTRFVQTVVESGEANGHGFESQDVFRFIKGTYLPRGVDASSASILISLLLRASAQPAASSQLSTLNSGSEAEKREAQQKPSVAQTHPESVKLPVAPASGPSVPTGEPPFNAHPTEATEGAVDEPESLPTEHASHSSRADSPDGDRSAQASQGSVSTRRDPLGTENSWDANKGDDDPVVNQSKSPWWKFW